MLELISKPKIVLITGAARRIGRALALSFAKEGWQVAAHYHTSSQEAKTLKSEIESLGQSCFLIKADLSNEQETQSIFFETQKNLGTPTVLINNASVFKYDCIKTCTFEKWDEHLTVNLKAPFLLSQAFAKNCEKGVILNILDQRVWSLTPHYLSYTVSKCGLWTLTQTLALALAPYIRVNGIGPGPTLKNDCQTLDHFTSQIQQIPLKKAVSLDSVCEAAHFLVNNNSVTGQMIAVDGGQHLGWSFPSPSTLRQD